jgi:dTDP-4-amino-4,6-dideoxygalactose transaminase
MSALKIAYENLQASKAPFEIEIDTAVKRVLASGWFINGQNVTDFEDNFATYIGAKYCIGVANGLDALTLSLRAMDYPKGSDIITSSNSYIATLLAILAAGHRPVLVEPERATYNLDATQLGAALTPKTRAIMPTHLYGKPAAMTEIMAFADKHGLDVFEDCAQSHGAKLDGKSTGTFGKTGSFSFYPTKNLGGFGDGGAITTDDEAVAQKLRALRNYGSQEKYKNIYQGVNSRLDEIQAAILNVKLAHLDAITAHKRELAQVYFAHLPTQVVLPLQEAQSFDVFHIFAIRTKRRDALRQFLSEQGIGTEIHYPIAPHRQEAMQEHLSRDWPIAEELADSQLSLPISFATTDDDVREVCAAINVFFAS